MNKKQNNDRLSALPQELKDKVMEHLSLIEGARMSCTSHAWLKTWKARSTLVLDAPFITNILKNRILQTDQFSQLVSKILLQYSGQLNKFHLYIPTLNSYPDVDQWICYLSRTGVSDISIESRYRGRHIKMSPYLFCLVSLQKLCLTGFELTPPPNFGGFRNCSCLEIDDTPINQNSFNRLVLNSPQLKKLKLTNCRGFEIVPPQSFEGFRNLTTLVLDDIRINKSSFSVLVRNSANLLLLKLTRCIVIGPNQIVINMQNLHILLFDEQFIHFDIRNMENLKSARFGLNLMHDEFHLSCVQNLTRALLSCSKLQTLMLEGRVCENFRVMMTPLLFQRITRLSLASLFLNDPKDFRALMSVIHSCSALQYLILTVAESRFRGTFTGHYNHIHQQGFLRVVALSISSGSDMELKVIQVLLASCPVLERLTVLSRGASDRVFHPRFLAELVSFEKLSPSVKIICPGDLKRPLSSLGF